MTIHSDLDEQTTAESVEHFRLPWQPARVIAALFIRDMTTAYGRSALGYLWMLLEPIGGILVLSIAFSIVLRMPALGESFPLFYATGFLPFTMYVNLQTRISASIRQSSQLLFYPAVNFLDVVVARTLFVSLTQVIVLVVVLSGIILIEDTHSRIVFDRIILAVSLTIGVGSSVGMINSVLFERFPAWRSVWGIMTRPMFFISGVFYLLDNMPEGVREILAWNPLVHCIALLRTGVYPQYQPDYISIPYVVGLVITLSAIGLLLLRANHRFIINN